MGTMYSSRDRFAARAALEKYPSYDLGVPAELYRAEGCRSMLNCKENCTATEEGTPVCTECSSYARKFLLRGVSGNRRNPPAYTPAFVRKI